MTNLPGRALSDLTDKEWQAIEPLLPPRKTRGRPRADDRKVLDGIFYVLHTGCQWKELPRERYGAYSTVANRLRSWQMFGIWFEIQTTLLVLLFEKHKLNLNTCYLDGSLVASKRGVMKPVGLTS